MQTEKSSPNFPPDSREFFPRPKFIWLKRLGWLVLIWSMSVLSLGVIAFVIKKFMTAAGMSV